MRLLSIGLMEPVDGFEDRLKLEFDILKDEGLEVSIKGSDKGMECRYYNCYIEDEILIREDFCDINATFCQCVANALSDIVINHWEPKIIKKIIKDNYFYFNSAEQNKVFEFTEDILNLNENLGKRQLGCRIKRKGVVLHRIMDYVKTHNTIIIDGFVRFRLKDYMEQLEETVDKATDEYLMDREYREFIKLLRHFVELQESKLQTVNVVFEDNEFFLFDEHSSIIEKDTGIDMIAKDNPDINVDDMIVSTLINLAPKRIVLHGNFCKEKREMVNALFNIFEGKVSFCSHCDLCLKIRPLKTK